MRNIRIEEDEKSINLALWGPKATSPVKMGNRISCSHLTAKWNDHLQEIGLNSTTMSDIKVFVYYYSVSRLLKGVNAMHRPG